MPELRPSENDGSRKLLDLMVTFSALSVSAILRERSESLMASRISPLARRRKRWRLPRLLAFGLSRRSTICILDLLELARGLVERTTGGGSCLPPLRVKA